MLENVFQHMGRATRSNEGLLSWASSERWGLHGKKHTAMFGPSQKNQKKGYLSA
ncbi:MAG: hypothetical protein ABGW84_13240 [Sphingomonadaceae bacterium]